MAKSFKLKFKIPSFQLCCSKHHHPTVPSIHRLSPMNPKACDVGYPKNPPAPPPSTPEYQCIVSPKITAIAMFSNSPDIVHCEIESTFCKMGLKARVQKTKTAMASVLSRSATRSDSFVHKLNNYIEEEDSESLLSFSASFSDEFYHEPSDEMAHSPYKSQRKTEEKVVSKTEKQGKNSKSINKEKVQKMNFLHDSEMEEEKNKGMVRRASSMAAGCDAVADGMVMNESFAVVKRSNDPYEDFRRSMVEMIMEMEMTQAEDLERLLQCFLALNSRCYHGVIVKVFMEIWQQLFSETSCFQQKILE